MRCLSAWLFLKKLKTKGKVLNISSVFLQRPKKELKELRHFREDNIVYTVCAKGNINYLFCCDFSKICVTILQENVAQKYVVFLYKYEASNHPLHACFYLCGIMQSVQNKTSENSNNTRQE